MKARQIEELDEMARMYIDGNLERMDVLKLNLFEMWYVLTMASVYSCTKIGTVSQTECVKMRYRVALEFRQYETLLLYWEMQHDAWIEETKKYSVKASELTRELAKDEPDAVAFIGVLCSLIDILTKDNVLHKLFMARLTDDEFKRRCHLAVVDHGDEWRAKFENIRDEDYLNLLDRFFAATDQNGMAQAFASLDADKLRDDARRQIPVKNDDSRGVAAGIRKIYGTQERKMY